MATSSEDNLRQQAAQGDEKAFAHLIRPHRQTLARYIRHQVSNAEDAEDVLQETLLAAWLGLGRLRQGGSVRAWLVQVARNRCRDHFRASGRRDVPAGAQELEHFSSRFGLSQYRRAQAVVNIVDALEDAPPAAREAARRFYLDGLSAAEIAAETHAPPGTVRRRLFQARGSLRLSLGVNAPQRSSSVTTQTTETIPVAVPVTAYPLIRPEIVLTALNEPPFAVDCLELRYWCVIPRVGETGSWGDYGLPAWELSDAAEARPAPGHGA